MTGRGGPTKQTKPKGPGRPRKGSQQIPPNNDKSDDENAPCIICKKSGCDHMIQCITCKNWECKICAGLSTEVYNFLTENENTVWFCVNCKEGTLETLVAGAQIKKRCQQIEEKYDEKFQMLEEQLESKAEKAEVDNIKAEQIHHSTQIGSLANDISQLNKKIDLLANEPNEKVNRERNLIIRGMPTSSTKSDAELLKQLLSDIGLPETEFSDIKRLGKIPVTRENTQSEQPAGANNSGSDQATDGQTSDASVSGLGVQEAAQTKHRPLKITVSSVDIKWAILKKAPNVRKVKSNLYQAGKIWIGPDQTKLVREKSLDLRKKLHDQRNQNPENVYVIKNGQVVCRTQKQPTGTPPQN